MIPDGPGLLQLMSVISRRFLLAVAIVLTITGSASAGPLARLRDFLKRKSVIQRPAVPNGPRRAPVPAAADAPYDGPPPLAIASPVRTPPLRKMKFIPPPSRGEDEERFEPVHPTRPAGSPAEDGRRQ